MNLKKAVFVLFFGFLIGCESSTENQQDNNLYGTWQLKNISGGFAGINDTLDISKDNYILSFNDNNEFSTFYNDTLKLSGSFEINNEKTIFSSDTLETIHYYDYTPDINLEKDVILYLNEDTLRLSVNFVDSFNKLYTKVK